jgi:hypothetical protein
LAKETRRKAEAFEEFYKKLPKIDCQGHCHTSCGPIAATKFEHKRIEKKAGGPIAVDGDLNCSMLKDKRCSVYEIRPTICRLFGVVEGLKCPYGCKPERLLTKEEGFELLEEARRISRG